MTPGGGIKPGEAPHVALAREVWEETGRRITSDKIRDELWNLRREFIYNGERVANHERFFLVETERFEARATSLDDGDESDWFDGFKWWPVAELPDLSCDFSPTSLGRLLRELRTEGPPRSPLTIEV
jgi:8-oxo-dGTP pyrophosphatase MutT (NUDIX family)